MCSILSSKRKKLTQKSFLTNKKAIKIVKTSAKLHSCVDSKSAMNQ